jgi:3',5'-nucleoside bisphosphate phosphatase
LIFDFEQIIFRKIFPMRRLFFLLMILISTSTFAQDHSHSIGRKIIFPDIPGYKTLKTDLHQHTAFSDGSVWPDIRVMEALMDGLDVISLTEHLEYQPHKDDIPHPDRNRSYNLALAEAKNHDLIIVRGSEITRKMPPGHNNAIFIKDANGLLIKDSVEIFKAAKAQGAFIFWNHPNWTAQRKDGVAKLTDMHTMLIKEKLLDGIEVVNDNSYSEEALQIALDNNLTIMGTSDIHKLIDWDFKVNDGGHRPVTLVFAKERTEESVKEAMFDRRTVVYYKDLLIGREQYLNPLLQASITVKSASYPAKADVLKVILVNGTNSPILLSNKSAYNFHTDYDVITLQPGENTIDVKTKERLTNLSLKFEVLSAVYAPGKHPVIDIAVKL